MRPLLDVLGALDRAGVRFVVVGGVAVVLHGHLRMTADLDLAVDLAADNLGRTLEVLADLGLRPRLPVDPAAVLDADTRRTWIEDRNLTAFSLHHPDNPLLEVDLLLDPAVPVEELLDARIDVTIEDIAAPIASIPHLITLKEAAGRTQDLADIEALRRLEADDG